MQEEFLKNHTSVYIGPCIVTGISTQNLQVEIQNLVGGSTLVWIYTQNLENSWPLLFSKKRKELLALIDIFVADGWPLVYLWNIFRSKGLAKLSMRCTGVDLLKATLQSYHIKKVAIVGGQDHKTVLAQRTETLGEDSCLVVDGFLGVDEKSVSEVLKQLEKYNPDVIFLALNTSKGALYASYLRKHMRRGVLVIIGAGLDFLTGRQKRAPRILQRLNLEWLFRLCHDPLRLTFRYLVISPIAFCSLLILTTLRRLKN